ncbi:hypothetical protein MKX01_009467 [Papaver californicum]|nr:hypothetical protein MKX01_009467 [Papaver californicum]
MDWRYRGGLFLIGIAVLIWVASAEITQKIFLEYKHPFAITYLGASLLAIYLPIAILKDWICNKFSLKKLLNSSSTITSLVALDTPMRVTGLETEMRSCLLADMELGKRKEGLVPLLVKESDGDDCDGGIEKSELQTWEVAKCSFLLLQYGLELSTKHSFVGDIFGLLAAVTYGLFTVLLKRCAGSEGEKIDVHKIFGYIGLFRLLGLWWLVWPLTAMGIEPTFKFPPSTSIRLILVFAGFIIANLSDTC